MSLGTTLAIVVCATALSVVLSTVVALLSARITAFVATALRRFDVNLRISVVLGFAQPLWL